MINDLTFIGGFVLSCYLFFCVGGYFLFYKILGPKIKHREILNLSKRKLKIAFELKYSFYSLFVFTGCGLIISIMTRNGWNQVYIDTADYSIGYFFLSLLIIHQIHDMYFFWTHRFLHEVKWLKKFHLIHHAINTPTPMAAFTFHPVEAFIQGGFWIIISFLLPVSALALFLFFAFMTYINMWGHCCYEFWTVDLMNKKPWKYLNTPTHHVLHHKFNNKGYSIYYNFWDKKFGSNHPEYENHYCEVKEKTVAGRSSRIMKFLNL